MDFSTTTIRENTNMPSKCLKHTSVLKDLEMATNPVAWENKQENDGNEQALQHDLFLLPSAARPEILILVADCSPTLQVGQPAGWRPLSKRSSHGQFKLQASNGYFSRWIS